eukprot:COSAG02_NODE_8620_length_2503_cov_1.303661_1_plen_195_part_00
MSIMASTYGPKRPSAPYFIFMAETRDTVKAENPGLSSTALCSQLGKNWRSLTPDVRAAYEKRAEDDRARFQEEYARWVIEHPEEVALANAAKQDQDKKGGNTRSKPVKRAPQRAPQRAPKRALTGYILFAQAVRAETKKEAPDAKVTQTRPPTRRSSDLHESALRLFAWPPACMSARREAAPPDRGNPPSNRSI